MKTNMLKKISLIMLFTVFAFSCESESIDATFQLDELGNKIPPKKLLEKYQGISKYRIQSFCQGEEASIWFDTDTGEYNLVTSGGVEEISRTEAQSWCQNNGTLN